MQDTLISTLSMLIDARKRCAQSMDTHSEWFDRHTERIKQLVDMLPSGSGIDCGTKIDMDASNASKIILYVSFHHMNDCGMYDGWTEHTITVTPAFRGISLRISGRDRNQIKEYLYETYDWALTQPVEWDAASERYRTVAA